MTTFSRETELSFHRKAAEQEARLVADLERRAQAETDLFEAAE